MPFPEVDTTFVMFVWMLQCVGLGVFFVLVAAELLVRSEGAKEARFSSTGARHSTVIDVDWRYADRLDARR